MRLSLPLASLHIRRASAGVFRLESRHSGRVRDPSTFGAQLLLELIAGDVNAIAHVVQEDFRQEVRAAPLALLHLDPVDDWCRT